MAEKTRDLIALGAELEWFRLCSPFLQTSATLGLLEAAAIQVLLRPDGSPSEAAHGALSELGKQERTRAHSVPKIDEGAGQRVHRLTDAAGLFYVLGVDFLDRDQLLGLITFAAELRKKTPAETLKIWAKSGENLLTKYMAEKAHYTRTGEGRPENRRFRSGL